MTGIDYIELILISLPLITAVFIGVWDYITTVYGVVYGHGYELNPVARQLLEDGRLEELMWWKGLHILLNIVIYVAGFTLYELGKVKDSNIAKYSGMWLMILFFISYFVGLIVVTLNIAGLVTSVIGLKGGVEKLIEEVENE